MGREVLIKRDLVLLLLLIVGASLGSAMGKNVKIEITNWGDTYLRNEGFVEIWCEVMNYGDPGNATVMAWISFQVDQGAQTWFEKNQTTLTLEKLTGDFLIYRFNITGDNVEYQYGFHVLAQTNSDGRTSKRRYGGWDEGLLAILWSLALVGAIYIGLRYYTKWVRYVTKFAKDTGESTRFRPDDEETEKKS
jgi:hypothetical protein